MMITMEMTLRPCLREPIPEIAEAAHYLDEAVSAHLAGKSNLADELIWRADMQVIREWTESLWGSKSPYVQFRAVPDAPPSLPHEERLKVRMPRSAEKRILHQRDGYHCRFCGIPVIPATVCSQKNQENLSKRAIVGSKERGSACRLPSHVVAVRPHTSSRQRRQQRHRKRRDRLCAMQLWTVALHTG